MGPGNPFEAAKFRLSTENLPFLIARPGVRALRRIPTVHPAERQVLPRQRPGASEDPHIL